MTPADLKALLAAATPGPWTTQPLDRSRMDCETVLIAPSDSQRACLMAYHEGAFERVHDASLVAALRNNAPLLVELWEEAEAISRGDRGQGDVFTDPILSSEAEDILKKLREAKP